MLERQTQVVPVGVAPVAQVALEGCSVGLDHAGVAVEAGVDDAATDAKFDNPRRDKQAGLQEAREAVHAQFRLPFRL